MSLGESLYSIIISGGQTFKVTRTSFSTADWDGNATRVATISNMRYLTRIDLITDKASGTYFLELYSAIVASDTDTEETFLWSFPIAVNNAQNSFTFFQPIALNTKVDLVIRVDDPYPTGSTVNMGTDTDNWLVMVEGFPRYQT